MSDDTGTFIGSSEGSPDFTDPRYAKQWAKMDNPEVTVIRDNVPKRDIRVEVFNEAINEILTKDTYDLLNGRFQSIDPIMEYMGRRFVVVVECIPKRRVYITSTYNPVDKLYRIFVSNRGRAELIGDVRSEGRENFSVDIISTMDNPYRELLRLFGEYEGRGYDIYNKGTYKSLREASAIVDGMMLDEHTPC